MYLNLFSIFAFLAAAIMTWLTFSVWKLRNFDGLKSFTLTLASVSFYCLFYGLEISSSSTGAMSVFYRIEFIGISIIPSAFLHFAYSFTGKGRQLPTLLTVFTIVLPAFNTTMAFLNPSDLYFKDIQFENNGWFTGIFMTPGILYWIYQVYMVTAIGMSIYFLAHMTFSASKVYRRQLLMILSGAVIPFFLYLLWLLEITPRGIDLHPFSFAATGILITIGIRRYKLFRIKPLARNLLFMKSPDPAIVLDSNQCLTDFNHAARKLLSISEEQSGMPALELFRGFPQILGLLSHTEPTSIRIDLPSEKEIRYYLGYSTEITDDNKHSQGSILVLHDVTNQKVAEQLKTETERRFRTVVEKAPFGVIYFDSKGIVRICNEKFWKYLDTTPESILDKSIFTIPYQHITSAVQDALSGSASFFEAEHGPGKEGNSAVIRVRAEVIRNAEGNIEGGLCLIDDITEIRKAQQKIESKNHQLNMANAEKDRFLSIVAHDLRSPVFALMGLTEMLAGEAEHMDRHDLKNLAATVHEAALGLATLIENLLEWALLRRNNIELQPVNINLHELTDHTILLLQAAAGKKSITVKNQISNNHTAYGDEKMVATVLRNLISNGIKFTHRGGKVVISAEQTKPGETTVKVADNGVGIPAEKQSDLFSITQKYRTPGTEGEPSSGLGLVLCRELINQNGGSIWIEDNQESGSIFCFSLPVEHIPEMAQAPKENTIPSG